MLRKGKDAICQCTSITLFMFMECDRVTIPKRQTWDLRAAYDVPSQRAVGRLSVRCFIGLGTYIIPSTTAEVNIQLFLVKY